MFEQYSGDFFLIFELGIVTIVTLYKKVFEYLKLSTSDACLILFQKKMISAAFVLPLRLLLGLDPMWCVCDPGVPWAGLLSGNHQEFGLDFLEILLKNFCSPKLA